MANREIRFLIPVCLLLTLGVLFVYSASFPMAESRYGYGSYFSLRQLLWIMGAALIYGIVRKVPLGTWRRIAPLLFLGGLILLSLLYVPGLRTSSHGAHRWLHLKFFSLQPSELMKPILILYLGKILTAKREGNLPPPAILLGAAFVVSIVSLVILFQPDYGGAMIMIFILFASYLLVGVPIQFLLLVSLPALLFAYLFLHAEPYRRERWLAFLDPWNPAFANHQAYQLRQSFLAFGNGGILGEGLLVGKQKLFYLPEAHTDFIFAVIGEELGFLGCMGVLLLFLWLLAELCRIVFREEEPFSQLVGMGMVFLLATEVTVNVGVVTGVLPPKGIALPFLSYGGSSLMAHAFMLGIFARMAQEQKA